MSRYAFEAVALTAERAHIDPDVGVFACRVPSRTRPGVFHDVALLRADSGPLYWTCSCEDHVYRDRYCWHVRHGALSRPLTKEHISRFWSMVDKSGSCWLWRGLRIYSGYGKVNLNGLNRFAHRVSWQIAHGSMAGEKCVLHRCDVRNCVNPEHLFLGTHTDNMQDRKAKGRGKAPPGGELHNKSKLTEDQVREIRRRFAAGGVSKMDLVREFGVTHGAIRGLLARRSWKNVQDEAAAS